MNDIYIFWENNSHLWFNASPEDDKLIYDTFNHYLYNDYNIEQFNEEEWTSYCILNDQLIKHFNRHKNINIKSTIKIETYYIYYNKFKYILSDFDFMFQLMPLRHTHELNHVKFVLNETWNRLTKNNNQFIKKFLIATYERYIKCSTEHNLIKYINSNIIFNHQEILDKISPTIPPFADGIITPSANERIDKAFINNNETLLYNQMKEFINSNNLETEKIVISISGGVDSMVCSYLLKQLTYQFKHLQISAVHIDYYNRPECEYEEELLIWWCNTILNIPLYIRRIDEINRPKCMEYELRDLYESYTKDVRFNSYIHLSNYIILGHNKDDTIENIFTNTASQSHYENLLGMTQISHQSFKQKNICFLRPLLNIPKNEIYKYAIDNNIPFLLDSTPKWSQRGKIRDIVKPALNEWNPLIFDGLIKLSEKMSEMNLLLEKIISPDINFKNINDVPIINIYWSIIFKKNNIFVSQKTLENLINKIIYFQHHPDKLRDTQKITLCKDRMLILKQKDKLYIYIQ